MFGQAFHMQRFGNGGEEGGEEGNGKATECA